VLALPGDAGDYLPPATEFYLDYFEPDRRPAAVNGVQSQLQALTREASFVYLAFPAGGAGEALAAVVQKLIRSGRPRNNRPAQILRVALEDGAIATPALLATAALVDLGLARAYQTGRVLEQMLQERASGLDAAAFSHYHQLAVAASAQVSAGRADARSIIRDFGDQLGDAVVTPLPPSDVAGTAACPRCGKPLVARHGTQGSFTGCAGYPSCSFVLEAATGVHCPQCLRGQLVERRGEQDRVFYGCTRFPVCRFTSTRKPVTGPCPECGNAYLVERTLKSGVRIECPRKDCGFRRLPQS
jgi:ssDNA-binding Zn-finger/Zn-ribbon topoisomerase 1